ncbi:VWA-like domain-containing protein [Roseibaca sp. V10]|uniref:VWA-like domain-containing protein n=1 Tax=Roseinatronobacter domitianus TaxID=2940293 RepID=A0ABT0M1E5_9RHOB|nr:VWA-like domain-containing protein [Roseibaca domitiana]MCL1628681.1 VWA-like domain-containing protein [Roseibaca domitiana]
MTHSARATRALQTLTERDPALAALSLWCQHRDVAVLDVPAETTGTTIRYGPDFETLSPHEQIGLAGHHILHVALQHSDRMAAMAARMGDGFAPDLWQIASDAIVNEAILQAGHALPRPALTLSKLLGRLNEQGGLADWDCERLYRRMADTPEGAGRARRQAAEDGQKPDLQPSGGAGGDRGTDRGGTGQAEWRAHLARAMTAGAAAGFGLGVLGRRMADLPTPRTPWEVILRRLLARATLHRPEPAPLRPARAWLAGAGRALQDHAPLPPFQPRMTWQASAPRLVLGLDCSASLSDDSLRLLLAEMLAISRRAQASLHLLTFDEGLHHDMPLDPATARATLHGLELPEGGGTDFRPVIARAAELAPSALVILSDMDGPTGPRPRFPVIWAAPQPDPPHAPFGHVLSLGA